MNRYLLSLTVALTFQMTSFSSILAADDGSARIERAVSAFKPLMQSGIDVIKVKKAGTVKEMLFALALKQGYSTDENDFSWVGTSDDAWETDSTNWGETDMKSAYNYLTTIDAYYLEELNRSENRAKKAKVMAQLKIAKENFKLFLNSGVKFGVAPMGAVQCGVTFAALAIIDPATGKIYLAAKEGSGC